MPDITDPRPTLASDPEPRSRRALLAGGLGGLAGLLTGALTRPLSSRAAAGDPLILGSATNSAGSAGTKLISSVNGNAFAVSQTGSGSSANGIRGDARDGTGGVFTSTNNNALFATVANKDRTAIVGVNAAASAGIGQAAYFDGGVNVALRATANRAGAYVAEVTNQGANGGGLSAFATGSAVGVSGGSFAGIGVSGSSGDGTGVRGQAGEGTGVHGIATVGTGVWGEGSLIGVRGSGATGVTGSSTNGSGVRGTSGSGSGVAGVSNTGAAVHAQSTSGIGVYGNSATNWSGYFQIDARVENDFQVGGNAAVAGSLSKGGGSFRIDHPLDPERRYLQHSFVESPDMLNVYSGTVTADAGGEATVTLPNWFEALNRDVRYQLTPIGAAMPDLHVKTRLAALRFTIAGAQPQGEVSWQITGIRQDAWAEAHRIEVEPLKAQQDQGRYLHPSEHGKAESVGIGFRERARVADTLAASPTADDSL